jgi:hypothetical protein
VPESRAQAHPSMTRRSLEDVKQSIFAISVSIHDVSGRLSGRYRESWSDIFSAEAHSKIQKTIFPHRPSEA